VNCRLTGSNPDRDMRIGNGKSASASNTTITASALSVLITDGPITSGLSSSGAKRFEPAGRPSLFDLSRSTPQRIR
jgi:hypothetical protein